ncbi:hypothetical protein SAMN00790413_06543 [Deinococcus hopiensis KR-140]|uniref:Uncharacterized protein n=1 Tax=Deinococcus hopiensis KR-140 TaxID=695939 RepID=A0A1W1UAU6_9DEIO|nr:hypothetical protein SAMN00790413_06543 [Deinococcus hopiensis KR-140]
MQRGTNCHPGARLITGDFNTDIALHRCLQHAVRSSYGPHLRHNPQWETTAYHIGDSPSLGRVISNTLLQNLRVRRHLHGHRPHLGQVPGDAA